MEFETDLKCRLYVGNLSFRVNEDDVKDMFGTTGTVTDVYLPRIYKTSKHKGFAFVEMANLTDAKNSILQLHEKPDLYGRPMIVRFADLRRSKEEQIERRKNADSRNNKRKSFRPTDE
jgi:RNA recognition motif-containing protein